MNIEVEKGLGYETIEVNRQNLHKCIRWAIDRDEWKHSWHKDITEENYPKFIEIIQKKMEERQYDLMRFAHIKAMIEGEVEINEIKEEE